MNKHQNIPYITLLQVFAFICVVFGHALSLFCNLGWYGHWHIVPALNNINQVIYAFHMPLFFLISGFLLYTSNHPLLWLSYNKKRFNRLIIPYYLAGILYYIPTQSYFNPLHYSHPLKKIGMEYLTLHDSGYLWFLITLFITSVVFTSLLKTPLKKYPWLMFLLLLGCNIYPKSFNLAEQISFKVMKNILYFDIGYLLAGYLPQIKKILNVKTLFLLILISSFSFYYTKQSTLTAVSLILLCFALFYLISTNQPKLAQKGIIKFISQNMLPLYIIHEPIMFGMLKYMNYGATMNPYLTAAVLFGFDLAVSLNIIYLYRLIFSKKCSMSKVGAA